MENLSKLGRILNVVPKFLKLIVLTEKLKSNYFSSFDKFN